MYIEGAIALLIAIFFIIIFCFMHSFTTDLYALQDEWRPKIEKKHMDRQKFCTHKDRVKAAARGRGTSGLTEGEIRRMKAAKRRGSSKPSMETIRQAFRQLAAPEHR